MKQLCLALALLTAGASHADGILSRYGTTDRSAATEILIINGQSYTAPAGTAARIQQQQAAQAGGANPRTGQYVAPVGGGIAVDPRTGVPYQDVGNGYVNTQNGQFIPK